jgi:hypothetical protein
MRNKFSNGNNLPTVDYDYTNNDKLKDFCTHGEDIILLFESGNCLRRSSTGDKKIENGISLDNIESYNGYIHGISQGCLYVLNHASYHNDDWMWEKCQWAPSNIYHISTTLCSTYIWLQYNSSGNKLGILYNKNILTDDVYKMNDKIRSYGKDKFCYVEINKLSYQAKVYPSKQKFKNVCCGLLTYHNEFISVNRAQNQKFKNVKLMNWKPFYIKK